MLYEVITDVLRIIGDYKSENKFSVIKMYLAFVYIELFVKTYIPIDYYITTDWSKQKNYVYHHNIAVLLEIAEENKKIPGKVSLIIKSNILQIEKYFRSNIGGEKINKYASMRYNFEKDRKADFKKIHFFFEDRQNEDVLFLYKKVTSDIIEELRYEQ